MDELVVIAASACAEVVSAVSAAFLGAPHEVADVGRHCVARGQDPRSPSTLPLAVPPGRIVRTRGRSSGPGSRNRPSWMLDWEQSEFDLVHVAAERVLGDHVALGVFGERGVTAETRRVVLVPARRSARLG